MKSIILSQAHQINHLKQKEVREDLPNLHLLMLESYKK